jgi:hypothetical protein
MEQIIYSRYEYSMGNKTPHEIFGEYRDIFESIYNERGVQISGVSAAIRTGDKVVILLTYSDDVDIFLRLKFYGKKDVRYINYRNNIKV